MIDFLILLGIIAGASTFLKWWARVPKAVEVWSTCVICDSDDLAWDLGEIEGPIDDIYTCRTCGHTGGPGTEYRTYQAELKAFQTSSPAQQWHAIADHWRQGHHQLSMARDYKGMGDRGEAVGGSSWPMMETTGHHHLLRAWGLFEQACDDPDVGQAAGRLAEHLAIEAGFPERSLERSEQLQLLFARNLAPDIVHRGELLSAHHDDVAWLDHGPRGVVLTGMGEEEEQPA